MHLLLQFCLAFSLIVGCSAQKPGQCPRLGGGAGTCVERCWSDDDCPVNQKCCSNGCGHVCMTPTLFPPFNDDGWPGPVSRCFPDCGCGVRSPCPCCLNGK